MYVNMDNVNFSHFQFQPLLGVSPSSQALLYVILSPSSSYFGPTVGTSGVRLYSDPNYIRAWEGGVGNYKMGSNYAPTIYVQASFTYSYIAFTRSCNGEVNSEANDESILFTYLLCGARCHSSRYSWWTLSKQFFQHESKNA